ncbi:MAG: isoleucine-tRNA ligase [Crocinitomicaceae bacterium]|jgi:isoleucyl-tRNA synthetase|nr:isoleucine-tRNA ligase [Crocinitomicaceae bacterium]
MTYFLAIYFSVKPLIFALFLLTLHIYFNTMSKKYQEYKGLSLTETAARIQEKWNAEKTFEQSVSSRDANKPFVFFEGPPSANGLPGIHHVMSRSLKDIFCRYKTLQGFRVNRKAGWDTHGLPVELGVEKELGITKEDIGKKISVDDYNKACKEAVMRYTDIWNDLTVKMGYWVDMENPYITYEPKYMESVWWLLAQLYKKNLMYKGYTIQPYSPAAGTGLSSHELNQPGCYRDVKDTTVVAQFKMVDGQNTPFDATHVMNGRDRSLHVLAWTTTPWTLPSNTALCVGPNIEYVLVQSYNQYTFQPINVILAKNLVGYQFSKGFKAAESAEELAAYQAGDKIIPYLVSEAVLGKELVGLKYEQLLPYAQPHENADQAFRVISGDFVTTEDGTGIVHIAPTFGSDDARVATESGVPAMLVLNEFNTPVPLVDLQGKFRPEMGEFAGMYVKNEYYKEGEAPEKSADVQIAIKLKEENKAFKVEKYEHSYPHCWRTDKPVLYYPLDSWFIRVTDKKDRLIALNHDINWKPESTGSGRFGKWLENVNDWNLSRSRFWGIPIPIWSTEEGDERIIIDSAEMLKAECDKAVAAGLMSENPLKDFIAGDMSESNYAKIDFHKNYVDKIVLQSPSGKPMKRESDLIDVWFDSGAMPYAQWHYPFENKEMVDNRAGYPADYIAEGVDQTRGWFYTLHTISTLIFDSVAYKNVISNGLVLDKNGVKMSKRLGNTIDPFTTLAKYGPDATRWYMITNAQPWDNLKFDLDGITEVQRKFFGTLYNTYSFLGLYANIDGFSYAEAEVPQNERPEIDRWILSRLNSLIQEVEEAFDTYEPTKAGRLIQDFVTDQLSNWYVRLCRRRFWKGDYSTDKISAYQTLYTCLETVAILGAPIAPFFMDQLFCDLNSVSGKHEATSVHLAYFPKVNSAWIDKELEAQMEIAQQVSSLVLGLRKKVNLRVRQPLQKIMVPALNPEFAKNIRHVKDLILSEVNVKELELLGEGNGMLVKSIKANFKTIGPKYGKQMKDIATMVSHMSQDDIATIEANNGWSGEIAGVYIDLDISDFEIVAQDIPGWMVSSENGITVALDITISEELRNEGIARELINRVQNLRKDSGLEVTDRIRLTIDTSAEIRQAIAQNQDYVSNEVLASEISFGSPGENALVIDLVEEGDSKIGLVKG